MLAIGVVIPARPSQHPYEAFFKLLLLRAIVAIVVDLVKMKTYTYKGMDDNKLTEGEIPSELLEEAKKKREELIAEIWFITKQVLPFTMGKYSYGLVGASKILFSVLPEIVLPIDNSQWLNVFQTVDLGDVIRRMTSDIQRWENATEKKLSEVDYSRRLTTLPSVYNVMAMAARPKHVLREVHKGGYNQASITP